MLHRPAVLLASAVAAPPGGSIGGHFTPLDWGVVIGYFAVTTIVGGALAGKPATMKDFFLGGRRLPWYAVAGSIVATEISAVTFVGVPAVVFGPGGNFTYLQLGLIAGLIARLFVAAVLVPAYYKRQVYSPYDYIGDRLGGRTRGVTTALFSLGGLLAQSARVYLTAVVLVLVLPGPLGAMQEATGVSATVWAIALIGAVAVAWTLLGGIATVIWTDVMLFGVFVVGGLTALGTIVARLPGGFAELIDVAGAAGKFRLWDLDADFSPTKEFTVWTAALAATVGSVGAYGTDQLMAQRIFCCRTPRQAQVAVMASYVGMAVTALMLLVGAGLYAYYQAFPGRLSGAVAAAYAREPDRIFPIFILAELPPGLSGLVIAGIFAAAVSSLDSILAALGQTTLSAVYLPWRARRRAAAGGDLSATGDDDLDADEGRRTVRASRVIIVGWGVLLCAAAAAVDRYKEAAGVPILSLALGLAGYVHGALLAAFLLAYLPLGVDGRGLAFAAPLSVLAVFAAAWHEPWAVAATACAGVVLLAAWAATQFRRPGFAAKTIVLAAGVAAVVLTSAHGYFVGDDGRPRSVAWPWYAVIGSVVGFAWGYGLAGRRESGFGR